VTRLRRFRSISTTLAKVLLGLLAFIILLIVAGLGVIETGWGKNRIRELIVRQANQYLTATLTIGRLEGSLLRGLQLSGITLDRDGKTLVRIDEVALSYSIRELVQQGVIIRRIRLTRPQVVGAKMADGRWDLGALVKRESREEERTGPNRPIEIQSIEIVDGRVSLRNPLDFGAAHLPTDFQSLNALFSFTYVPVRWTLKFDRVSWVGHGPELTVNPLSGAFGRGPGGWFFEELSVTTPRSTFTLDGRVNSTKPTSLDLRVRAPRFAFQEWSGVLRGLTNIAVEGAFDTSLKGPVNQLDTDLRLTGTGGAVHGRLTLDTSVPGWHGTGAVDVEKLNLARWLNRGERASDITGHVTFNLALELGRRFPRGMYTFNGPHAMYMNYEGDAIKARGQITATAVLIAQADATAYGAKVTTRDGSIGIDAPFPFHFQGTTTGIDLRRVPANVPVPHVESRLTFDYDVEGRFNEPFITGRAVFAQSEFLGATVGSGTVGSIDTLQQPLRYTGDGDVTGINLRRFGEGLDVAWLRDPRYSGTVSGHFRVDGAGASAATLVLTGGGRLSTADLFKGTLSDADVSIAIEGGTLRASYDGRIDKIDPSVPFADPRLTASLTGAAKVDATVRELLTRTATTIGDYDVSGTLALRSSTLRDIELDSASVNATLRDSTVAVAQVEVSGPAIEGRGAGRVVLADETTSDFQYDITRGDLAQLRALIGQEVAGSISTKGRITGPYTAMRAAGDATLNQFQGFDVTALALTGRYDLTVPSGDALRATARITGRGEFLTMFGQAVQTATGTFTYDSQRLGFDVQLAQTQARNGQLAGTIVLDTARRAASILDLTVSLGRAPWRLAARPTPPVVSWNDQGLAVTPIEFVDNNSDQRIAVDGTWRQDGTGALHVKATHVYLDTLQAAFDRPTRYGGVVDLDATLRGTRADPQVSGTVAISNGRVERVSYQKFGGRFAYTGQMFDVDLRLDQSPGVWITAVGKAPAGLFNADLPEQPIDVAIKSSTISLGLIEGITGVVRGVAGDLRIDVKAIGTSRDPHVDGAVEIGDAAFLVVASGATYKNGRVSLTLAHDKITVNSLHIEDVDGQGLDVHGSLGTHELRVGELEIEATARGFEVMRNELGRIDVDAAVHVRGRAEAPRIAGTVTINSGSLRVDEILARALYQPYSTVQAAMTDIDPVRALNPWDRLGLDVFLRVPGTLRLVGENVQISPGTPIGLGDINLRVTGDLYLYKDPAQPVSVTGSFDSISGTYVFQGRRFDVVEASSINFRGDLNPEIYVTVRRVISGVETRVSIFGPLQEPELRLASTPPLDQSDILSLILFNTSTNQLSAAQQQELVVRAGALAAGFLAAPILSAIESEIGIDIFEIEPGEFGTGPKVTIGEELAPGLVARFSRQFGQEAYDEAVVEYYLSRILRLRATFSDAQSLNSRSPFRRVERAGIDFLIFFSF
jgi:autotransporter translocation and assembly factor TamB